MQLSVVLYSVKQLAHMGNWSVVDDCCIFIMGQLLTTAADCSGVTENVSMGSGI